MKRVNCRKCVHYYITWDEKFPYGCRAYEFKTNTLPSVKVFQSSGLPCQLFTLKEEPKK